MSGISKHFHILDRWQSFVRIEFDMLIKQKLSVKNEPEISLWIFRLKDRIPNTAKVQRKRIKEVIQSRKVKTSVFPCLITRPNYSSKKKIIL